MSRKHRKMDPAVLAGLCEAIRAGHDAVGEGADLIRKAGVAARNALVEANLRLATLYIRHLIQKGWIWHEQDRDDLIATATLGLVQAADTYDPSRATFSVHAFWAMKHTVYSAWYNGRLPGARMVRIKESGMRLASKLRDGIPLSPTKRKVAVEATEAMQILTVLTGGWENWNPIGASPRPSFENKDLIVRLLGLLMPTEREIIQRHDLDQPGETLASISRSFGLSRPWASQVRERALSQLRRHIRSSPELTHAFQDAMN